MASESKSLLWYLWTAKTWWTSASGKPFGLLLFGTRPYVESGSIVTWALDGDSGAMKPVLWPYLANLLGMWYSFPKPVSRPECGKRHRAAF